MTLVFALLLAFADVASVKSEPNPEKRSELALANADQTIADAHTAYNAGDMKKTSSDLDEVRESVDISYDALEHSGKPARNSKYFKRAEIKIREMIRRLGSFRDQMSVEDRKPLDAAVARLQDVHDKLLSEIMSKNKR